MGRTVKKIAAAAMGASLLIAGAALPAAAAPGGGQHTVRLVAAPYPGTTGVKCNGKVQSSMIGGVGSGQQYYTATKWSRWNDGAHRGWYYTDAMKARNYNTGWHWVLVFSHRVKCWAH